MHAPHTIWQIMIGSCSNSVFFFTWTTALIASQEPGVAEKEFSPANARHLVRNILCNRFTVKAAGPEKPTAEADAAGNDSPLPPWLTEADVDAFASAFERTGFTAAINYYRNMDRNWELATPWSDAKVAVPTKFIVGDGDLTYHYTGIQDYLHKGGFKADVPMLQDVVVVPGAGHFIQQEKADEVSNHIYDFIAKF
jgi:pimeloyl-ACP methyl ester carboxylesterase